MQLSATPARVKCSLCESALKGLNSGHFPAYASARVCLLKEQI